MWAESYFKDFEEGGQWEQDHKNIPLYWLPCVLKNEP